MYQGPYFEARICWFMRLRGLKEAVAYKLAGQPRTSSSALTTPTWHRSLFVHYGYIRGTLMVHLYTTCSKLEIRNLNNFHSLKINQVPD